MHFSNDYIGLPWVAGQNDCYNFVKRIWRNHYQIDGLPLEYDGKDAIKSRRSFMNIKEQYFTPITKPIDGCAVVMKQGRYPVHVGIWLEELQGVLHCIEKSGVIFTKPDNLYTLGYEVHQYYKVKNINYDNKPI